MRFCVQCGQQLAPEARFCVSCGTPAPASDQASTTTSAAAAGAHAGGPGEGTNDAQRQPEYAAAGGSSAGGPASGGLASGQGAAGQGSAQAQQQSAAAPAAPKKSGGAFAGVPVSDYVRDGIAALALIMSLFMVWTYSAGQTWEPSKAATRVDVILITLVSLLSLGLSYVWRAGVFGPGMGYRKIQDMKLLANVPYVLLVVTYVALNLITADRFEGSTVGTLGPAAAFGLAGALLAAQPRRGEIAPGDVDRPRNQRWIFITLGVAGLAAVVALVQIIRFWVSYGDYGVSGYAGVGILVTLLGLASPAILVFIALQVNKLSDRWRTVGVALALGAGFLALLALFEDLTLLNLTLSAFGPEFSLFFWMAFGAAVSAPSVARLTQASAVAPTDTREVLKPFLLLAAGISAILALGAAIGLITVAMDDYADGIVPQVLALFFGLLLVAGAIGSLRLMGKDLRSAYVIPSGYAGLLFVLGLVLMIVWAVQKQGYLGSVIMLLTFVVPAAILAALWLPAASREQFRSLPSASGAGTSGFTFAGAPSTPAGQAPGTHAPVQQAQHAPVQQAPARTEPARTEPARTEPAKTEPATTDDGGTAVSQPAPHTGAASAQAGTGVGPDVLAEAANPETPLARLQELAANHPQTRPAVAANPATYPALLTWLGQLGDPAVDQAIRQRS